MDGELAALKNRYQKVNKMKQAKVSFQLRRLACSLKKTSAKWGKKSRSNLSRRPAAAGRGVLARPPAVRGTDTVHHSREPEQRCGGRERPAGGEAVSEGKRPTHVWCRRAQRPSVEKPPEPDKGSQRTQIILQHITVTYTFLIGNKPGIALGHLDRLNCDFPGRSPVQERQHSFL